MKERVKNMYDQITMPEAAEEKIRQTMVERKQPVQSAAPLRRILATVTILVLLLSLSPTVRAAVNKMVEFLDFGNGLSLYIGKDEDGNPTSITGYYHTEEPAWAKYENGRLYFLGHGENIDITDKITEEEPYFYSYADEEGYVHHMVVAYTGELSNFGIYEFIREDKEGLQPWEGWVTGAGRNFLSPETMSRYPWVDIVWEELGIPWSMPGEETFDIDVTITENEDGEAESIVIEKET